MTAFDHALRSAKRFGNKPEDYLPIHDMLDQPEAACPDPIFRALFYNNDLLNFIAEKSQDPTISSCRGIECFNVPKRLLMEAQITHRFGRIPAITEWVAGVKFPLSDQFSARRERPDYWPRLPSILADQFGGQPSNFLDLVAFFNLPANSARKTTGDLLYMNSYGIFMSTQIFGHKLNLSSHQEEAAKSIDMKSVARAIIIMRWGFVPGLETCLSRSRVSPDLMGTR